ncbi:MAG: TetR/AcrR family transcriptional regulator [Gammaproteobacteria bacterium]
MPKIAAENIEEHIRRQTTRILDCAADLFATNGYRGTDLGSIAKSMGLARNSLYRYFPSKDHILVAVMQREMLPLVERTAGLNEDYPDPLERIDAWLDLQMQIATGPCHEMIRLLGDMNQANTDLRQNIRALHGSPRETLQQAVAELLDGTGRDAEVVSAMVASMAQSAGGMAMTSRDVDAVIEELKESVRELLTRRKTHA